MDMPPDMKKQLMQMAGITDVNEFDKMASTFAEKNKEFAKSTTDNAAQSGKKKKQSPFQVHFVKMLTLIGVQGQSNFDCLNKDIEAQLKYVYEVIDCDDDYNDMFEFMKKYFQETNDMSSPAKVKEKAETSRLIRDRGNKAYSKKEFEAALLYFGQSALMGPIDKETEKGREVAVALANRSAVHFEMEQWCKCLDDIKASFLFGYPDELVFKLYERKGRCFMSLERPNEAATCFEEALNKVNDSKLEDKKKETFVTETEKKLQEAKKNKSKKQQSPFEVGEDEARKCPFEIWERNPAFPPLSDALGIAFNQEGGRHICATRSIIAGEPLVIEEPVSSHLSPHFMTSNCAHCLSRNGTSVLPSPLNPKARFCCMKCFEDAMKSYHRMEAKIDVNKIFYNDDVDTSQMSGCISLAYRAVTQKPLSFFLENKEKLFGIHDIQFGIDMEKGFSYTGDEHYRGLYNLVNHQNDMKSEERQATMVRTVVLLKCLRASGYFQTGNATADAQNNQELSHDELYIGKLLFHFQTGIQYNLHAVYQVAEKELQPGKRIPITDIGSGCYPTTIFFNHSCSPNTVRINQGKRVVYVAKRNICAGDQVTDCYGIHHLYNDLNTRQESLLRGYMFKCTCSACLEDYGTLAQLTASLSPNIAMKLGNTMTKYKELFTEGKVQKALKCCQEYLGKLEELKITFPHRNYEVAAIALCSCLWALATRKNS